jgi:hypothetical protein
MKTRFILLTLLAPTALLIACNILSTAVPTPQGDPLAPTDVTQSTPQGDPMAPTVEVFNPLDPSPTPSGSDLPLTCQVTDLNIYVDEEAGYCFAYPLQFTLDEDAGTDYPNIYGPGVGDGPEKVRASFTVVVMPLDLSKPVSQQADEYLKDFSVIDPATLPHAVLTVAGGEAVMVDDIPTLGSWRMVFVPGGDSLYRLMYWPVDVGTDLTGIEDLYQTTVGSFSFLAEY